LVFVAGAGGNAAGAYAQGTTELTGVQVTGSRIKQANLTNSSSLTIISDKELQYQGTTNVETLLNNMPQTYAGFSTGDSNGATGTATVDLRGLGAQETLVLIDGKRLMAGDPTFSPTSAPSPDLNFIPAALIDRIDILSGGASAVYGSDAVAGVVNFIMKKDFQGFRIDSQVSRTDHSDGTTVDNTLLWGNNFSGGKGNITLYAGYQKMEAVNEGQRGWSTCSLATGPYGAHVRTYHYCGGSGTIPDNKITSIDLKNQGTTPNQFINNPNGSAGLIPFRTPGTPTSFNFAPYNYLQRPDKRWRLGGFAHDQLNKHVDIYGSAMFMDDHTVAAIAPTGLFGTTVKVPCNSTFLAASDVQTLCTNAGLTAADDATLTMSKRLVELGPRESDLRHDQYRVQVGVRGDIIDGVSYDTSYQRRQGAGHGDGGRQDRVRLGAERHRSELYPAEPVPARPDHSGRPGLHQVQRLHPGLHHAAGADLRGQRRSRQVRRQEPAGQERHRRRGRLRVPQ
jgi:outer membrane receptor protein involved in Fe transport